MKEAIPSGKLPANLALAADGSKDGCVASTCRTITQWRQPLPLRRISAFYSSGGGPKAITKVRHLFEEIRRRGYTGSFSHLARFLAPWRSEAPSLDDDEQEALAPVRVRTLDAMTGRAISPLTAAALCVKPRGQMTARQAASVDALKAGSAEFTTMRRLAMQFRAVLRSGTTERLDAWLTDARASGIYAMQRFAKTIRQDLEAVRNAVSEPWSNGQTEGQINKLKTLKRAMYGRAASICSALA